MTLELARFVHNSSLNCHLPRARRVLPAHDRARPFADNDRDQHDDLEKTERVQVLVDRIRARLKPPRRHGVHRPENPLLVSVSLPERDRPYGLAFEGRFLDRLSDDELRAVVAHELGHVDLHAPPALADRSGRQPDRRTAGDASDARARLREGMARRRVPRRRRALRRRALGPGTDFRNTRHLDFGISEIHL